MSRLYIKHEKRFNVLKNTILCLSLFILANFFLIQIIQSNSFKNEITIKTKSYKYNKGHRGNIYDRNGNLLAYSIQKCLIWINASETSINDKNKIIDLLSNELSYPKSKYKDLLINDSKYLVIEKDLIVHDNKVLIEKIKNIKQIRVDFYNHRLYPYNELAAQLIGFTNYKNQGKYGIEGYFNKSLTGSESVVEYNKTASGKTIFSQNTSNLPSSGSDITLTIDIKIQEILQNQLSNALSENKAKSANGIIVNPINGEILAMASIPDFDLNNYNKLQKDSASYYFINRPVSSAYEPGSTFKIVCFIEGIENELNNKKEKYFCENGFYKGRYINPFKDHDDGYDSLTFDEIFTNSSNIGTIKIFQDLSMKSYYRKIQRFGFGIKSNISLMDEHKGDIKTLKYFKNNIRDLASASIGQSILVTNLQMALAYSSIANGGFMLKPQIIKEINCDSYSKKIYVPTILYKTMNEETSKIALNLLEKTVREGTAKKTYLNDLNIGGKTGTAEIWDLNNKEYSKNEFISSFASVFPIENPKYVMIISIEAPMYNKRWGGESAVPCAKSIIEDIIFYDKELIDKRVLNAKA
jgi:stage V sporulation protein D (sporulation-specific penicillin-binding protein)